MSEPWADGGAWTDSDSQGILRFASFKVPGSERTSARWITLELLRRAARLAFSDAAQARSLARQAFEAAQDDPVGAAMAELARVELAGLSEDHDTALSSGEGLVQRSDLPEELRTDLLRSLVDVALDFGYTDLADLASASLLSRSREWLRG